MLWYHVRHDLQSLTKPVGMHVDMSGMRVDQEEPVSDEHAPSDERWQKADWNMIMAKISDWGNHTVPAAVLLNELTADDEKILPKLLDVMAAIRYDHQPSFYR